MITIARLFLRNRRAKNGFFTHHFLEEEWPKFLSDLATVDKNILVTGDLNFQLHNVTDKETVMFNSILQYCAMKKHANEPTHVCVYNPQMCEMLYDDIDNLRQMCEMLNEDIGDLPWTCEMLNEDKDDLP